MWAGMKIQKTAMLMVEMIKAVPHFSLRIVFCVSDITWNERKSAWVLGCSDSSKKDKNEG